MPLPRGRDEIVGAAIAASGKPAMDPAAKTARSAQIAGKIVSGRVSMAVQDRHTDAGKAEEYILTC